MIRAIAIGAMLAALGGCRQGPPEPSLVERINIGERQCAARENEEARRACRMGLYIVEKVRLDNEIEARREARIAEIVRQNSRPSYEAPRPVHTTCLKSEYLISCNSY